MANRTEDGQAAQAAVRAAANVCRRVQAQYVTPQTLEKKDRSPVTVADYASQAVVLSILGEHLPGETMIAEEDASELRLPEQAPILEAVRAEVSREAGRELSAERVCDLIDRGGSASRQAPPRRFWTLDPIDGTKGFLRNQQYAVALALIEDGEVVLGALACPNYAVDGREQPGELLLAEVGGSAWSLPLGLSESASAKESQIVRVSSRREAAALRLCESVESGHSDQDASVRIAKRLGVSASPVRMDSQAKYAAVARGEAEVYLRLPTRADYRERIWDHAAGFLCVRAAGGRVTDVDGRDLDFGCGERLENNRGVIASNGPLHDAIVEAAGAELG